MGVTTRDIVQKMTNLVMAPINQHDERLSNAIQCGVAGRQVQKLMNALVDKTGVDVLALEQLIKTKSSIQIPKAINDLDNKELEDIYGINRDTLMKIKRKKLKELSEFRVLKKQTLVKIYHIKNGSVDELEGKKMQKKAEIDEDEDDVKEYDVDANSKVTAGYDDDVLPTDDYMAYMD